MLIMPSSKKTHKKQSIWLMQDLQFVCLKEPERTRHMVCFQSLQNFHCATLFFVASDVTTEAFKCAVFQIFQEAGFIRTSKHLSMVKNALLALLIIQIMPFCLCNFSYIRLIFRLRALAINFVLSMAWLQKQGTSLSRL